MFFFYWRVHICYLCTYMYVPIYKDSVINISYLQEPQALYEKWGGSVPYSLPWRNYGFASILLKRRVCSLSFSLSLYTHSISFFLHYVCVHIYNIYLMAELRVLPFWFYGRKLWKWVLFTIWTYMSRSIYIYTCVHFIVFM